MKKQLLQACLLLAAIITWSFTNHHSSAPQTRTAFYQQPEICYPLTDEQADKLGGELFAGQTAEPRLQAFFREFNIRPVEKKQMVQQFTVYRQASAVNKFQCNTGWTYFYTYGSCTANYSRPECGYYVRVRYYKKYRFYACRYEEVTISSTVVCC
jgi:hypothetical protein